MLRGRTLINLFFEASTRTQSSFELAGKRLGADVMNMNVSTSSVQKGETLIDTAMTLNAMRPDIIVVRHHAAGAVELLAQKVDCSVINAGDGAHQHPTQALLDALTIRRAKGRIAGLTVAICGDILHSRVARSNINVLNTLGARVRVVAPSTLLPAAGRAPGRRGLHRHVAVASTGADIVMMLRLQRERMQGSYVPSTREYFHFFGLDHEKLARAKPDAIIMHPGPMNRGVEIASTIADHSRSVIRDQVEMGVAVRMAVLEAMARQLPQPLRSRRHAQERLSGGSRQRPRSSSMRASSIRPPRKDEPGGLLVKDGMIADLGPHLRRNAPDRAEVVDCKGHVLCPGLIDMQVFTGEPGLEHRETLEDREPCRRRRRRHHHRRHARHRAGHRPGGARRFHPAPRARQRHRQRARHGGHDEGPQGPGDDRDRPAQAGRRHRLHQRQVERRQRARHAQRAALRQGPRHADRPPHRGPLSHRGQRHELRARWQPGWGCLACTRRPRRIVLERDVRLVEITGGRYHAATLSCAESLDVIRSAKARKLPVTCGVSINHLTLNENDIGPYRTFLRLKPPLRAEEDRAPWCKGWPRATST